MAKKRRVVWIAVAAALLVAAVVFGAPILNAAVDAYRAGFFEKGPAKHAYSGTSLDNLKALYQATQLYYEANAVYPSAETWMDDLKIYLKTNDLKKNEELKKFVNPRVPQGDGVYGYAFNDALSGKWKEDLKDPKAPLIFESKDTSWNAHGDPAAQRPGLEGGDFCVTVAGDVVPLADH